jgi:hypothetical protein
MRFLTFIAVVCMCILFCVFPPGVHTGYWDGVAAGMCLLYLCMFVLIVWCHFADNIEGEY